MSSSQKKGQKSYSLIGSAVDPGHVMSDQEPIRSNRKARIHAPASSSASPCQNELRRTEAHKFDSAFFSGDENGCHLKKKNAAVMINQ